MSKTKLRAIWKADAHAKLWAEALDAEVRKALKAVWPDWLPRKGEALTASVVFRMPRGESARVIAEDLTIHQIGELLRPERARARTVQA